MAKNKNAVRQALDKAKAEGRTSLTAPEGKLVCDAYGIPVPKEGVATSADEAAKLASGMGFPVVLKIVSPQILHKTEAGGVLVGVDSADAAKKGFDAIMANAKKYDAKANLLGVQVQQMLKGGQEVIVGAVTDGSFGKLVAFGLGGVLVEVLKDITFRLAPATKADALSMLDGIQAAEMLKGVRGGDAVNRDALAELIVGVSELVSDFPEISEMDLNPVFATKQRRGRRRRADRRRLQPEAGALSPGRGRRREVDEPHHAAQGGGGDRCVRRDRQDRQLGDEESDQRRLQGADLSDPPEGGRDHGPQGLQECEGRARRDRHRGVRDSRQARRRRADRVRREEDRRRDLDPSGFAETGNHEGQAELVEIGRKYNIRMMGPNIYGFYYTPANLCATFCTAYDFKGSTALSSQSGGIGMAIIGFSRSAKMGVSAIVGLGNKSDIDEDDLLLFFEQDPNTKVIAQHCEDLKDGRAFAEVAKRVSKKKPVIMLKAGRTSAGAAAASSHTGALAGNDKIYEDVLAQSGVIRAKSLRDLLDFARGVPMLPTPKGENVVIITGAGGSGVLLSDACVDNGLKLLKPMPADLDAAFRKFIPPFGAAGNPVDITGGEPPLTYMNTVRLGLEDERIHALILGYWHTIVTPPMVFARNMVQVIDEMRGKGIVKPVVASLAGDVEVEEAAQYLYEHGIPAYAYSTEIPVAVLGAKYQWARGAGLL